MSAIGNRKLIDFLWQSISAPEATESIRRRRRRGALVIFVPDYSESGYLSCCGGLKSDICAESSRGMLCRPFRFRR